MDLCLIHPVHGLITLQKPNLLVLFRHEMGDELVAQIQLGRRTCHPSCAKKGLKDWAKNSHASPWRAGLVILSSPSTKQTGAMYRGREIESHLGILGWLLKKLTSISDTSVIQPLRLLSVGFPNTEHWLKLKCLPG
jgi:hypothetical protein